MTRMQTIKEWEEEQLAIHEGRATALVHCYICYTEKEGRIDTSPKADLGPLRGIMKSFTNRSPDPTQVMVLNCGHHII